jgi:hypothetical protein
MKNKLCELLVDLFPKRLLYWCSVKIFAEVSTSKEYGHKIAGEITLFDANYYYLNKTTKYDR